MLGLPLGYAGRATVGFGRRLMGHNAETVQNEMRQQAAAQVLRVLGEHKGGAMKFGQALTRPWRATSLRSAGSRP